MGSSAWAQKRRYSHCNIPIPWNSKIREAKAIAIGEHLADGCYFKSTARLVKVDPSPVRRLNRKVGQQGQMYHEQEVQDVVASELQADERHGLAGNKQQPAWEVEVMDPQKQIDNRSCTRGAQ